MYRDIPMHLYGAANLTTALPTRPARCAVEASFRGLLGNLLKFLYETPRGSALTLMKDVFYSI